MPYEALILASASPRRSRLLAQIGVRHDARAVGLDETRRAGESPRDYVRRLAREKAEAALGLPDLRGRAILAADTVVVLDDAVFGKPAGEREAVGMLMQLGGRTHEVLTAVALLADGVWRAADSASRVSFRPLGEAECRAYWTTGEPADKAGAYAIQGLAAAFVTRIEGSYSGVMGLPLCETAQLLDAAGIARWQPVAEMAGTRPVSALSNR